MFKEFKAFEASIDDYPDLKAKADLYLMSKSKIIAHWRITSPKFKDVILMGFKLIKAWWVNKHAKK